MAVCDDRAYFGPRIAAIASEAAALLQVRPDQSAEVIVEDRWKGPAYGVASEDQRRFILAVARGCGLVLDPVYTGKALYALAQLPQKPESALFIHTGGLPGLLASAHDFASLL